MRIAFNHPVLAGSEFTYMRDAIARSHIAGDGEYTRRASAALAGYTGGGKVLLTTSCSHALDMSALLLDIAAGDEVIMPSFTFAATANAFVLRGAQPVFVDIRPDTLNIDETLIEQAITPRTRAICVVHYAGVGCEMDEIVRIAKKYDLAVVEDNAHGLFGRYRGQALGSIGALATQSFHETKNISCGEGGALIVNDASLVERAEIIREKGTNRAQFYRGSIDKYTWVEAGSSYLPSDLLAAFLCAQLEAAPTFQLCRRHAWERYDRELADWAERYGITTPTVPSHCDQPYHLYYMLLPTTEDRDELIAGLASRSITAVFHYVPLHVSGFGSKLGYRTGMLPVTESASARLVRLPLYNDISDADIDDVIKAVRAFVPSSSGVNS